jgi:hypothetical protein
VSLINHDNVNIWKGIIFKTMEAMNLADGVYSIPPSSLYG